MFYHFYLQLTQNFEEVFVVRLFTDIMDINVNNLTLFINDKDGTFGLTFRAKDAIFFCDCSMRPEIGKERVIQATEALGPG